MKKLIAITLLISVIFLGHVALASEDHPLDIPVKTLYSAPLEDSNVIFEIPMEVTLQDISQDGNWYLVKISFYIGPFGYIYVGWAYIPVAKILAERDKETLDLASLLEDNQ